MALVARSPRLIEGEYQTLRKMAGENVIDPRYLFDLNECNAKSVSALSSITD
ncbi:hypothetical protein VCR26J2_350385 [Vibrio coralliirubri]|nr:hypothetical protein VCR1J2_20113 [Vibrio coralliirubri]CDT70207.1 hypothetical protein VCR26J2_350385 [Vibrio coralliirubri]CDT83876.1 hypothetical protein VCR8J2_240116 [Vibrio coralliirubri]